jgi:hypothetical protein
MSQRMFLAGRFRAVRCYSTLHLVCGLGRIDWPFREAAGAPRKPRLAIVTNRQSLRFDSREGKKICREQLISRPQSRSAW